MPIARLSRSTAATGGLAAWASLNPRVSSPKSCAMRPNSRCRGRHVIAHHVREKHAVAGAVRTVRRPAKRVLQRMHERDADVGEGEPRQQGAQRHGFAGCEIAGMFDGPHEVGPDRGDRSLGEQIAQRVLPLIERFFARRKREYVVVDGRVGLDGVRERVDAAIGGHFAGARERETRVDESAPAADNCSSRWL